VAEISHKRLKKRKTKPASVFAPSAPFVAIPSLKLIVISPESEDARELPALPRLFAAGLAHYHVRKPAWDRGRLAVWLRAVPDELHPRLVLHTHHELADDFALGGLHERENTGSPRHAFISRACHDLAALRAAFGQASRVLLSPVFPSISKPGHAPDSRLPRAAIALALAQRTSSERQTEVVALGGVNASRIEHCRALHFDGAAVLGAVWLQPDPVAAFNELLAHAR
jgi:thiamine-phosphate pyrophosphorylase